jgi:hypothetical protein
MTQHDCEVLAQFAVGWRMLKYDKSLRACLTLDLCAFLDAHCREFDHQAYWAMVQQQIEDGAR